LGLRLELGLGLGACRSTHRLLVLTCRGVKRGVRREAARPPFSGGDGNGACSGARTWLGLGLGLGLRLGLGLGLGWG